ncbi:MAG: 50S ribosomal protein L30e [Euryarchaeota archaeon]|jgi:large subunit ribosomal protein L30e|nr:50S ribosomal protein L30e [Euryarchaeota archaeon]MDP6363356.1 50S ribosomal protein L30e [Candidatus Poseidoniia archaeon]MDP6658230.1 50S ribosomal protein L30e [Candidatus Poseidoniia archaeon]MDP6846112.1 50S ribosomal protein L30e [Candidatus Poseidoniia archaeon]MDP7007392.1 50S ribosomal protein L30e [Candidatus Poseidoniia archaeon]|tara:strand:+ start:12461 stop:12751 length:291 start_codon:yes stop_codon:yes gene_type:complete
MDLNKALRKAIATGEVNLGANQCCEAVTSDGARLVILANNCPAGVREAVLEAETDVYQFDGTNSDLGAACGKPFPVSAVTVLEGGSSEILRLKPNL